MDCFPTERRGRQRVCIPEWAEGLGTVMAVTTKSVTGFQSSGGREGSPFVIRLGHKLLIVRGATHYASACTVSYKITPPFRDRVGNDDMRTARERLNRPPRGCTTKVEEMYTLCSLSLTRETLDEGGPHSTNTDLETISVSYTTNHRHSSLGGKNRKWDSLVVPTLTG